MTRIKEGSITFEFGDVWSDAFKWDDCAAAKRLIESIAGSKAVDFVAIGLPARLLLMEVKDYRVARPGEPPDDAELATTVARKVRDSLAGIVAASNTAARGSRPDARWKQVHEIIAVAPDILVLLWCEGRIGPNVPAAIAEKRAKASALPLMKLIARQLRWLTTNVMVVSSANAGDGGRVGLSAVV